MSATQVHHLLLHLATHVVADVAVVITLVMLVYCVLLARMVR